MSQTTVKTRFAPSPTGEIHLGNLRTALFNWLYAAGQGGNFLLRIEDTDQQRSRPKYVDALLRDLRWLGLDWQEGPQVGGDRGPYFQAQRPEIYQKYYDALAVAGATYPCFCSDTVLKLARKAQRAAGQPPRYPGTCAHLSADEIEQKLAAGIRPTLRFRVPPGQDVVFHDLVRGPQRFMSDMIGDFIIRRSDGTPAFFFCNALDDALMVVTHVLRGEDHLTNTPRQLLILQALGLPVPAYGHLSLLVGDDGAPLSKRHGSHSIHELHEQGYLPDAILNYLARLGHHYSSDKLTGREQLAQAFSLQHLGKAPARFDSGQLRFWQREAISAATNETLLAWFRQSAPGGALAADWSDARLMALLEVVRANIEMPGDVAEWLTRLSGEGIPPGEQEVRLLLQAGHDFFQTSLDLLDPPPADFRDYARAVGKATGTRGKELFMPLRVALTGVTHGPEMAKVWDWLGRDRCRGRLQAALDLVEGVGSHAENL